MNCLCKSHKLHAVGLLHSLSNVPLLPMTSKNCQFKYSEILLLQGTHIWEPEPLSLSFIVIAFSVTLYRLALHSLIPPLCCLVFASWLCSYLLPQYFNSDYVLFLSSAVFFSLSPSSFPWPSFPLSGGVLDQRVVLVPGCDNTSC